MMDDFGETVLHGAPTHYTAGFDETGRPLAVPADAGDIAGALPVGWDDRFWDWLPRFNPAGSWVQIVDDRRDYLWARAKAARAAQLAEGIETAKGRLQIDEGSMEALRGRALRMSLLSAPASVTWTMADNSEATFSAAEFLAAFAAAEDRSDEIHRASQALRAQIFDPANDTLEKLDTLEVPGA